MPDNCRKKQLWFDIFQQYLLKQFGDFMKINSFLLFLSLTIPPYTAAAPEQVPPLNPLKTSYPPRLDGVLDDTVWQQAPSVTGFSSWYPDFKNSMSQKTRVWYAYDRDNLYFAFRCFDTAPHLIKSSVSARDKMRSDDWICLNIDTFNDQQGLYAFYVNPDGIQGDSRAIGSHEDLSMDFVWYSRGKIDEQGYCVEVRIPLKSIRYEKNDSGVSL